MTARPTVLWRLVTPRFARTAFSGEGARLYGGRWNRKGVPMVYTAGSLSLAVLEMLVQDEPLRARYRTIAATLPVLSPTLDSASSVASFCTPGCLAQASPRRSTVASSNAAVAKPPSFQASALRNPSVA